MVVCRVVAARHEIVAALKNANTVLPEGLMRRLDAGIANADLDAPSGVDLPKFPRAQANCGLIR
jgi:hypothetical protein